MRGVVFLLWLTRLRSTVAAVVNRREWEQIEATCAATGKSVSEVVRQGVRVVLTATQGLGARR